MKGKDLKRMLGSMTNVINSGFQGNKSVRQHMSESGVSFSEVVNNALSEGAVGAAVENANCPNLSRSSEMRSWLDEGDRDLALDCGYPARNPSLNQYRQMYDEEGFAARLVGVLPAECWAVYPEVYVREDNRVTAWEKSAWDLIERTSLWHYVHRADRISGIGHYGVLFLGLDGGTDLSKPAIARKKGKPLDLMYVRPLAEYHAAISELEGNTASPRYGQPLFYNLTFADPTSASGTNGVPVGTDAGVKEVHWSRVIHIADNTDDSDIYGVPRMQQHYRRLLDLRKVYAGSAEMYWQGAFPGFSFDANPDLEDEEEMDIETVQEQIQLYMDHLQRYLASTGGTFRSLAPQVVDPTPQIQAYITIICAVLGCPLRIFLGSESGVLASELDKTAWNRRISQRQVLYCEPMIVRKIFNRLNELEVLGSVSDGFKYKVSWTDLNALSDKDKADVALKRAQTMLQYLSSGGEKIVPLEFAYEMLFGMTRAEGDACYALVSNPAYKALTEKLWTSTAANLKAAQTPAQQTGNTKIRSPQSKVKTKK